MGALNSMNLLFLVRKFRDCTIICGAVSVSTPVVPTPVYRWLFSPIAREALLAVTTSKGMCGVKLRPLSQACQASRDTAAANTGKSDDFIYILSW